MRRRPVVVAVVVAALALLVGASAGCSRPSYRALEAGQCLPEAAGVEGWRASRPLVVDCGQPHRYEVFARQTLEPPDDAWPGEELLDLNSKAACAGIMPERLGITARDLPDGVLLVWISPTPSSWKEGDRDVECLLKYPEITTDTLVRAEG